MAIKKSSETASVVPLQEVTSLSIHRILLIDPNSGEALSSPWWDFNTVGEFEGYFSNINTQGPLPVGVFSISQVACRTLES